MSALSGTIPALLTPFTAGGERVDFDVLDAHLSWLHERGVRAVSPMGTTGEGPSLSLAERKAVIERIGAHPSRMRMLAGTGCTNLPETIELSHFAVERGADGLLVAPPSYYEATPAGVTAYFARLLEALPPHARVFLYHIPSMTGVPIEDETLLALEDRFGPVVAGAKDSSGDLDHVRRWLREYPHLTILSGSDAFVSAVYAAGGPGTITLLANVFPDELEAIRRGEGVDERQGFLTAVRALVGELPRHAALKHLLHLVSGVPRADVRPPLQALDEAQIAYLETRFSNLRSEAHV
jgi:4-hydroxy-tetrahydrodipicolinate synthase